MLNIRNVQTNEKLTECVRVRNERKKLRQREERENGKMAKMLRSICKLVLRQIFYVCTAAALLQQQFITFHARCDALQYVAFDSLSIHCVFRVEIEAKTAPILFCVRRIFGLQAAERFSRSQLAGLSHLRLLLSRLSASAPVLPSSTKICLRWRGA